MIHPTAVIHPDAQLGSNVSIGPYAVIEGAAHIGDGCEIQAHAVITGPVEMGQDNVIGYGAIIGAEPQDFAFKPHIRSTVAYRRWEQNSGILHHPSRHHGKPAPPPSATAVFSWPAPISPIT